MTEPTTRVRKTRDQLDLAALLRDFIKRPLSGNTLEALCADLVKYELAARFKGVIEAANAKEDARAEVKAKDICRGCRLKLDESNRARVDGYQCLECTRKYKREDAARRRALAKAATP
jgi:hypothetical protein